MNIEWPEVVSAISSGVSVIILALAAIFAVLQIRGIKKQTSIAAFTQIHEQFGSDELVELRRVIFAEMPDNITAENIGTIDSRLYSAVYRVLGMYNGIGFLIEKGSLPLDRDMAIYIGPPAIRMWSKLETFVRVERDSRNEEKWVYFFENLVTKCRKKYPEYHLTYF